ncbi:MAG: AI-2E family transporter [Deltaproteobacteria bacterium]|nr:AI-2E family transporter [Deltaproteobacteria bacterium]
MSRKRGKAPASQEHPAGGAAVEPGPVRGGRWGAAQVDVAWAAAMVAGLLAALLLLSLTHGVAITLSLALAVTYVLNPVVSWLAPRVGGRAAATSAVFVALVLAVAGAVVLLVPALWGQAEKLPAFVVTASRSLVPRVEEWFGVSVPEFLERRVGELGADASGVLQDMGPSVAKVAARLASNTAGVLATAVGLLVVPVIAFFLLVDYPQLLERMAGLFPRRHEPQLRRRFSEVDAVLSAFVRGQLTVGALLSVLYGVGLWVARLELAIVIGLVAGFGNMVPYVGTALGALLALFGLVLAWQGPWQLAVVVGTFLVAQALEGLVITPRVVGDKVGLSPVVVIVAVLAFGELFGFVGVLLAVPASAVLKVVGTVVLRRYQDSAAFRGDGAA